MREELYDGEAKVIIDMPTQTLQFTIEQAVLDNGYLDIAVGYFHPKLKQWVELYRKPSTDSFSQRYLKEELECYIVQEVMADVLHYKHSVDWVE